MRTHDLSNIYLRKDGIRRRASSYDPSGGNDDRIYIKPGETKIIFDVHTSGLIEHIWMTELNEGDKEEENVLRKVVLKIYWEDSEYPQVLVPLGDFFGMGHAKSKNFVSAPLQMSPENGKGFNCFFPMPFRKSAKIAVKNEGETTLMLYYYIDYEEVEFDEDILYFHAFWNRKKPRFNFDMKQYKSRQDFQFGGFNRDGKNNYVILDVIGKGHYVGCNLNIDNFNLEKEWDWPGEGDDMIFIDGEKEPSLHGTGTEDYVNMAWCPRQEYSSLYHGIILGGDENWKGKITYYRYHILDPITFKKSIKVTIEGGHNNNRNDDLSSTAYFYLDKPYLNEKDILPVEERLPLKY